MNCKPGDLAVIVKSEAGNLDKFVSCIRLASIDDLLAAYFRDDVGPVWVIDRVLPLSNGRSAALCADSGLRPIRDQPGNEQFVVEARKSLPRSKPATTKGDTITERGELA